MLARKAVRAQVMMEPHPGAAGVGMDPAHRSALEALLSMFATAVALEMRCELSEAPTGESQNGAIFRAHFAAAQVSLEAWNAAVDRAHAASQALWRRLAHATRDHGISEPPFVVGALIDHVATRTLQRSRRWDLGTAQETLLEHFNDRLAGDRYVSVYMLGRRVAILPGGAQPDVQRRVEAADSLIRALFDDARTCMEAQQVTDAHDALLELKQQLSDDRERDRTLAAIAFAPDCPRCQSPPASARAQPVPGDPT